ncbi:MAG: electron transfer flavoprotein subunit alpha/FixB family protein [Leadbetterella sp.]
MNAVVLVEMADHTIKGSSLEVINFASQISGVSKVSVLVQASVNDLSSQDLGKYGAEEVHVFEEQFQNSYAASQVLYELVTKINAEVILCARSPFLESVLARTAAKSASTFVANVTQLPLSSSPFVVQRSIYSGKAFATTEIQSEKKFISVKKNASEFNAFSKTCSVTKLEVNISEKRGLSQSLEVQKASSAISLPEASIVVSGGRGMQGPDRWAPLEELANVLGAATACSKPVSDLDWRPHHEHVGQTGVKVSPNLYIACGISGAIQHLAGVNSSRVIVVINKDPEAPFFKSADYGIVGDVFEVLPKITAALKA